MKKQSFVSSAQQSKKPHDESTSSLTEDSMEVKSTSRKDALEEVPSIDEKDSETNKKSDANSSRGSTNVLLDTDSPMPRKKGRPARLGKPKLMKIQSVELPD